MYKSKVSKSKISKKKIQENMPESTPVYRRPWYKHGFVIGILGLALLLVFVSIAYSVVVIWMGTNGNVPKIMTAPIILFDMVIAGVAFSKIFK